MEAIVTVYRGYTHAVITVLRSSPVARDVGRFLTDKLIENEYVPEHNECINGRWQKVWGKWVPKYKYFRYDEKSQKMYIPIAYCDEMVRMLTACGYHVVIKELNDYETRKIDVHMKPGVTDQEHQVELIAKCSDPTPGMKGLSMQTGKGKTYAAIKSWVNLGYAGIVIVKGLMDQWIKSIREFTDCDPDYIYKIQEFNSLALLAQNPQYKPNMFVASLRTLQIFAEGGYDVLPWSYKEFMTFYGIGTKIIDEVHQAFHATSTLDLMTNVKYNLYCSATFTQSGKKAREIFLRVFPLSIQYGRNAYDKYISIIWINYYGAVNEKRCVKKRGYMHAKYENELLISERKFNDHCKEVIIPYIDMYYINRYQKGYKALIFCASINFVEALVDRLSREYPDKKVISYLGGDSMDILGSADIIVSTTGKSGTGLDVKNLVFAMNTVSGSSEVLALQMAGRLRKKDGVDLIYVDRCDLNIQAQVRHGEYRKEILRGISSRFFEYNGLTDLSVQTGEVHQFATV